MSVSVCAGLLNSASVLMNKNIQTGHLGVACLGGCVQAWALGHGGPPGGQVCEHLAYSGSSRSDWAVSAGEEPCSHPCLAAGWPGSLPDHPYSAEVAGGCRSPLFLTPGLPRVLGCCVRFCASAFGSVRCLHRDSCIKNERMSWRRETCFGHAHSILPRVGWDERAVTCDG